MRKLFLFAIFAAAGFLAWRWQSARRSAAPVSIPKPQSPVAQRNGSPVSVLLEEAPRVIGAIFGQPTRAAGVAPGTTYDPNYVLWTYSQDTPMPEDYRFAGIY